MSWSQRDKILFKIRPQALQAFVADILLTPWNSTLGNPITPYRGECEKAILKPQVEDV